MFPYGRVVGATTWRQANIALSSERRNNGVAHVVNHCRVRHDSMDPKRMDLGHGTYDYLQACLVSQSD